MASAQWTEPSSATLTTGDLVGIGTTPSHRLHVVEGVINPGALIETTKFQGTALWARADVMNGTGLSAFAGPGASNAIRATSEGADGETLFAWNQATSGDPRAIQAQVDAPNGYSGYFVGGRFYCGSFMGVGRHTRLHSSEAFGVGSYWGDWGGMYVDAGGGAKPYYGYANAGTRKAYHFYEPADDSWRLFVGGTRMVVKNTGAVGIGTMTPTGRLTVNGTAFKPGGGTWSSYSDERLKKDVAPIVGALEKLLSVRGVTFEYVDPDAIGELHGERMGVIAQELEEVFPDWVEEADNGYKSVTFRGFEGVVIEAFRELAEENAGLRETVEAQRGELEAVKERLARIEAALAGRE